MSIFDRFKKPGNGLQIRAGTIDKQPSYIMLIPKDGVLPDDASELMERLMVLPLSLIHI